MARHGIDGEQFYQYGINLFRKTGHTATSSPIYCNHTAKDFIFFDKKETIYLTEKQRLLLTSFDNVSQLFLVNGCTFFSINLLCSKRNRSQTAYDINEMICHAKSLDEGTICLFRHEEDIMLSFEGFGYQCALSDWYSMGEELDELLERLDIVNTYSSKGADYLADLIYSIARDYYLYEPPSTYDLFPIDFISNAGIDGIDREALDQYVENLLNLPKLKYGYDYVAFDENLETETVDLSEDLDMILFELDNEDDVNFEGLEGENYELDGNENEKDEYIFDWVDPEIFDDPTLMVKWLERDEK